VSTIATADNVQEWKGHRWLEILGDSDSEDERNLYNIIFMKPVG
jgi:hypothetical protein